MGLKGKIEAVIYAAEEPVTVEQISLLVKAAVLQELAEEKARAAAAAAAEAEAGTNAATESQMPEFQPEESAEIAALAESMAESVPAGEEPNPYSDEAGSTTAEQPVTADEQPASDTDAAQPSGESEISTSAPAPEVDEVEAATVDSPEQAASEQQPGAEQPPAPEPLAEAAESAPVPVAPKRKLKNEIPPEVKARVRQIIEELFSDYASSERGMEIRRIAGGFRMATKPEHHDAVKAFVKSLKPPLRLSLPALETLAVVAYKQPVTAPEVGEIRGVDSQGVIATLLDRKLITTAGRKAVIGRPILYKTTKEFLLRFGLKDVSELPSMEEFEKLAQDAGQVDMFEPEDETLAGPSTLHDVEPSESDTPDEGDGTISAEGDIGGSMDHNGDPSVVADSAESVVGEQVKGEQQGEAGQELPSEPDREVPGDYSSGADTEESVVRAQVEGDEAENTSQPASEESMKN